MKTTMTKEQRKHLASLGMAILKHKDIRRGLIDENFEPFNGHLSAEKNKRCWRFLAEQYMLNAIDIAIENKTLQSFVMEIPNDRFYYNWLLFLQAVEGVVRSGNKDKGIESIINGSGISETTWIRFLD